MAGRVYLIGAGPGDPGLITVKGLQALREADVVMYDALDTEQLLKECRSDAELIDAGKRAADHHLKQWQTNDLLVEYAKQGKTVVRLKGGDPFLFGRGAEEAEKLRKAGVEVHVIPGVTSAISVPELAGIPVTHRDHASLVTFITGHEKADRDRDRIDWTALSEGARDPGHPDGARQRGEHLPRAHRGRDLPRHPRGRSSPKGPTPTRRSSSPLSGSSRTP
ncbi:MAG: uroporphyrinogen-III C-methyltransferase [Candidatus Methanomethylophilus sp.]|jgi:uroporphyrin-III C-methyltransferase|nr:uroporphyrinogen-III C-methyltransferase [Methanomethylophilus sp.]